MTSNTKELSMKYVQSNNKVSLTYNISKRFMGVVITLLASPLIMIVIILVGIMIKIDDGGSVFFTQQRVGKNEKEFTIYKIRSMVEDAEGLTNGASWAIKDDPRITKVGKVIRKFRIDELPQFINVLNGTMSIVGPRPERRDFTEKFHNDIPGFKNRLIVKPGITGLAQINGGYDLSPEEKLKFDLVYISNYGLLQDLKILIGTVRVVLTGDGAR